MNSKICETCFKGDRKITKRRCAPNIQTCHGCYQIFIRMVYDFGSKGPEKMCDQPICAPIPLENGVYKFDGHKRCCEWAHFLQKGYNKDYVPVTRDKKTTNSNLAKPKYIDKHAYNFGFDCVYPKTEYEYKRCVCQKKFDLEDKLYDKIHWFSNFLYSEGRKRGISVEDWIKDTIGLTLCPENRFLRPKDVLRFLLESGHFKMSSKLETEKSDVPAIIVCSVIGNEFPNTCLFIYYGTDFVNLTGDKTYKEERKDRRYFIWTADNGKTQNRHSEMPAANLFNNGKQQQEAEKKKKKRHNESGDDLLNEQQSSKSTMKKEKRCESKKLSKIQKWWNKMWKNV